MKPVLSSAGMRAADRFTIESVGIPGRVLMESAGREATAVMLAALPDTGRSPRRALVLCGKGNNGGDGLVVARELLKAGLKVQVRLALGSDGLAPDAAANLSVLRSLNHPGLEFAAEVGDGPAPDLIVDALLGTGQVDAPRGPIAGVLNRTSDSPGFRVALDIPTGLNADTGEVPGVYFRADLTIAIAALKLGHLIGNGPDVCGEVQTVEIGIPRQALMDHAVADGGAFLADDDFVRANYPARARRAHKYHSGPTLIVGGSRSYPGAPVLSATAAARVGSGYVVAAVPQPGEFAGPAEIPAVGHDDDEALAEWLARARAVLVGPGLGRAEAARTLVRRVVESEPGERVVDADGLRALKDIGWLDERDAGASLIPVLTPHSGEFAYLTGEDSSDEDPVSHARAWSARWNAVLVLKGAPTIVASPDGKVVICPAGGPALATAGTGDVLAGMCAGLLAMGMTPFEAAVSATHLGGAASDDFVSGHGRQSLMASDLVRRLPRLLTERFRL